MPSAPSVIAVSSIVSPFVAKLRFFGVKVDDVGAQAQFGELKRRERPRALFEEHVGARLTREQRPRRGALELARPFENVGKLLGREIVEIDEATANPHRHVR